MALPTLIRAFLQGPHTSLNGVRQGAKRYFAEV